jgi:maltose alpha-D-glucosyltransferase/alpha-amylase
MQTFSGLEALLAEWMPTRRWFRSKSKTVAAVRVEARASLGASKGGDPDMDPFFCIVRVEFTEGTPERYVLPLVLWDTAAAETFPEAARAGILAGDGPSDHATRLVCDASWDPRFPIALWELLAGHREARFDTREIEGGGGGLRVSAPAPTGLGKTPSAARLLGAEQSNTSFAYPPSATGPGCFIKLYRRLEEGVHPEPEMLRFLRDRGDDVHVPRFESSLVWEREGHTPVTVGMMQDLVAGQGDAWEYTLRNLPHPSPVFLEWVAIAGRRVAALHAALASAPDLPDFAPEPLTAADLDRVRSGICALLDQALENLEARRNRGEFLSLHRDTQNSVDRVLARPGVRERLADRLAAGSGPEETAGALKIRTHGDLHLGQIFVGAGTPETGVPPDLWILDFEGEPGRPLAEARRKQSPMRDVAGMLRSFHYAAHTVLRDSLGRPEEAVALASRLCAVFWNGYAGEASRTRGAAPASGAPQAMLDLFVLEKTVYELYYELNNRPDWMEIPLRGLIEATA